MQMSTGLISPEEHLLPIAEMLTGCLSVNFVNAGGKGVRCRQTFAHFN